MKRHLISTLILSACAAGVHADNAYGTVGVSGFSAERHGDYLAVDMTLGLSSLDVESNRAVLITPSLVSGTDSLALPSVAIYGRRRYYYYKRNYGGEMLSGKEEKAFRSKNVPSELQYHQVVPYRDWFSGARIVLDRRDYGCCREVVAWNHSELGETEAVAYVPRLIYVRPAANREKRRALEGSAYIDFPVNRTDIQPAYRNNEAELRTIRSTIDAVRNDHDATIDTVWLKGYASPESPYQHNARLAMGRTEALKDYVNQLYRYGSFAVVTDYEPEDWEGLRKAVEASALPRRSEILALIDTDMDPDRKEELIRTLYPEDYRYMLTVYYPALRHTDYRVSYVVRSYSDPRDIMRIMREEPGKLDLNEFYVAAEALEPGSKEFTEVFETAVKVYPNDEVANLNAANAALARGDAAKAGEYLESAGESAEAVYARGVLAAMQGDRQQAEQMFRKAGSMGLGGVEEALDGLKYVKSNK